MTYCIVHVYTLFSQNKYEKTVSQLLAWLLEFFQYAFSVGVVFIDQYKDNWKWSLNPYVRCNRARARSRIRGKPVKHTLDASSLVFRRLRGGAATGEFQWVLYPIQYSHNLGSPGYSRSMSFNIWMVHVDVELASSMLARSIATIFLWRTKTFRSDCASLWLKIAEHVIKKENNIEK